MAIMSNLYPQNFSYSMHDVLYQDTFRLPSYHLAPAKKGPFVVCMDLQHHINQSIALFSFHHFSTARTGQTLLCHGDGQVILMVGEETHLAS